jgi:fused signal recognition particle receptor
MSRLRGLLGGDSISEDDWSEVEESLIAGDVGATLAGLVVERARKGNGDGTATGAVRRELASILLPRDPAWDLAARGPATSGATERMPAVVLVVGVNGTGKTTTIGKLAAKLRGEGRGVVIAAGDTFRAAAIEQLKIWGERTRTPVIAGAQGSDSASLAFNALTAAKEQAIDVLLIDTAGRLQNKAELMNELEKVVRVIRKVDDTAPHAVLLVLDATVGQNALSQVEAFHRTAGVTGLVMTKLDGTARGGILVALAEKFKLPVHFIGVGEGVDDLAPFTARDFARAIAGIE